MKKIVALTLVLLMAATVFSGCGVIATAVTVDGTDIASGVYLMNQIQAYSEATEKIEDSSADVLKQDIEGVAASEWIHNRTIELCKRYVAVERLFDEQGMSFTAEETAYYDGLIAKNYASNKKAMEQNGVGEANYTSYMYNTLKANTLFTEKYFDAVENSEVATYLDENYVSMKYVSFPYMNTATYTFLSTEEIEQQTAAANKALDEVKKDGITLEDVVAKYLPDAYKLVGNETQDFSTPASLVSSTKLQKGQTSTTFTTEFIDGLFDTKIDEYGVYEGGAGVMVYQKVANYNSDDELTYYKSSLLTDIKGEDFEAYLAEAFGGYAVSENSSAVRKFSPKNIVLV